MKEPLLPGIEPTDAEWVSEMTVEERVDRAILLLQANCPPEGYYLAFSGGKDSCAAKKLCELAGVKFEAWYNNTTIDAPELVKFIKEHHKDVRWNMPAKNMMTRIAEKPGLPPTRGMRWCCDEYKEGGGNGRVKVFGVRQAESDARKRRWTEIAKDTYGNVSICPIVFWTDDQLWEFIRTYNVKYCSLYDEGFKRLGCVGCPLAAKENQEREFARWPRYRDNWRKAIIANWEKYHDKKKRNGEPYSHAKFKTGEDMWQWWITEQAPDYVKEGCQIGLLWTQ